MRHGPWVEEFLAVVGGGATAPELPVAGLSVAEGTIAARVAGCEVALAAELVPRRVWAAMTRFVRGNAPLEAAVAGRVQSQHLDHLLREDWGVALVPNSVVRSCSCDGPGGCIHVTALVHAAAAEFDRDPSLLLRWRGCTPERARLAPEAADDEPAVASADAWEAGELPPPAPPRPLPAGAVLKRLGPVGVRVADRDLVEALQRAYDAFARSR